MIGSCLAICHCPGMVRDTRYFTSGSPFKILVVVLPGLAPEGSPPWSRPSIEIARHIAMRGRRCLTGL